MHPSSRQWEAFPEFSHDPSTHFPKAPELREALLKNSKLLLGQQRPLKNLKRDLKRFHLSSQSLKHFNMLQKGEAVVVTTGQQPCLLLGPSLIFHKIFSMISIVEYLKSLGIPAIPIFWCASEDHDLSEILNLNRIIENRQTDQPHLSSQDIVSAEGLPWSQDLERFISTYSPEHYKNLFIPKQSQYYSDHFIQALYHLFAQEGIIIIEPRHLRSEQSSLWKNIDLKKDALIQAFEKDESKLLQQNITLQAPRRHPLPIFTIDKKTYHRDSILYHQGIWEHSSTHQSSKNLNTFQSDQQTLSPGALLRPALAQQCLPILVSVLGPAEYLYHQQNRLVFQELGLHRPLLWPRLTGTYIPDHLRKKFNSFGIHLNELLQEGFSLKKQLSTSVDTPENDFFDFHQELVKKYELQHSPFSTHLQRKLQHLASKLSSHIIKEKMTEQGASPNQIHYWMNLLKPKQQSQERIIGGIYLIPNPDHLKQVQAHFSDPFDFTHRIYS